MRWCICMGGTADPEIVREWFLAESRAEHLRQHQRVSHIAENLQSRVRQYKQAVRRR
ncbi:MFS transporter [Agrobacterium tumefaciens]|uniref:MFS transporter n=1 Tax=Agrobacterium tumefaciens TaxID=358 RepID=UPI003BA03C5D